MRVTPPPCLTLHAKKVRSIAIFERRLQMHVGLEFIQTTIFVQSFRSQFSTILEPSCQILTTLGSLRMSLDLLWPPWVSFSAWGWDQEGCQRGSGHDFDRFCGCFGDPKVTFGDSFSNFFGIGFWEGPWDYLFYDLCMFLALVLGVLFGIMCCWLQAENINLVYFLQYLKHMFFLENTQYFT